MKRILFICTLLIVLICTMTSCSHEHQWSEWQVSKAATCTQDGLKERSCACGEKETDTIIASHNWKDATCTEAKTCSKCGLTDGSALGHTCSIGTCTRCNNTVYPTVILPSTPLTVRYISTVNGRYNSMNITKLSYEFNSYGSLVIYVSGTAKYFGLSHSTVAFSYKVLDENGIIIDTGNFRKTGLDVGDYFANDTFTIYSSHLSESSKYTIVITDRNY